jgi:hypothetical protein
VNRDAKRKRSGAPMIDWITFEVRGVMHRPVSDRVVSCVRSASGEIEWQSPSRETLRGSASSTIQMKSKDTGPDGFASTMVFDGNPSKFLQGHNLYGSDDVPALIYECAARAMFHGMQSYLSARSLPFDAIEHQVTLHALARAISAQPRAWEAWRDASDSPRGHIAALPLPTLPDQSTVDRDSPHVSISRVDINYMANVGTDHDAQLWIANARATGTFCNRPARGDDATTVYFAAKKTQRIGVKFYSKGPEFAVNYPRAERGIADEQQHPAVRELALLATHASGKLRAEITMRTKALKEAGLRYAANWNGLTARQQWMTTMENFDMPQPKATLDTSALPAHLASAYALWLTGQDLSVWKSRRTRYRIRRELRERIGVDIFTPCADPLNFAPAVLALPERAWPRNVVELFPADDEPAPAALVAAGLYFEPRGDWRIADRPTPPMPRAFAQYCPWPRDAADHRAVA